MLGALALLVALAARAMATPMDPEDVVEGDGTAAIDGGPFDWVLDLPWQHTARARLEPDAVTRAFANAPPIADVVAAAERAAGVASDPVASWRHRSRLAALIPRVSLRVGNSESWRELVDPSVDPAISRATTYGGTLSWRFDRLVFDPNEPRFAAHDVARRRERRRIARVTVRAYVAWIEQAALAQSDPHAQLGLIEATADLDALTDAWFSHTLANLPRSR